MSLFRAREWFEATLGGGNEEFAHACLVVANIDNAPDGAPKVVTGSLQGKLRVHCPQEQDDDGPTAELLDIALDLPILQLAAGRFVPHDTRSLALAVLHPRRLSVYAVGPRVGGGLGLELIHGHALGDAAGRHFTAFNMACGPFGGESDGGDGICVQALDGKLMIFEQGAHAFSQRLPDCLIPGPLCYVPKTDSFVTATAGGVVECYRYGALAEATEEGPDLGPKHSSGERHTRGGFCLEDLINKEISSSSNSSRSSSSSRGGAEPSGRRRSGSDGGDTFSNGKRLRCEWSVQLGEQVNEICVGRVSSPATPTGVDLVVMGDRSLFVLAEAGGIIRSQKRLDRPPSTVCLYARAGLEPVAGGTHPSTALADLPPAGHNLLVRLTTCANLPLPR